MKKFFRHVWAMAFAACLVLALPTTAALAAHLAPQAPHFVPCLSTTETDNIQPSGSRNPFNDDLGNQWIVYYDIKQDVRTFIYCGMRVDVRIFNPQPDGSWNGTVDVLAYINGTYDSYSYQKVSGSGTIQAHYVWRGPWFGPGESGSSYHIEVNEFNGSTPFTRAYADFTL